MASFIWPTPGQSRISSKFGMRKHPISGKMKMHSGIDISAPAGTPIHASESGKVTFAGISGSLTSGYGRLVKIAHADGYETRYAHQSQIQVMVGQQVIKGQQIGKVGTTGSSTGNHLHFEVRKNGTALNPSSYVSPTNSKSGYTASDAAGIPDDTTGGIDSAPVETSKPITTVTSKLVKGESVSSKFTKLTNMDAVIDGYELLIENDKIYAPIVKDDIVVEMGRKNTPSSMTFTVVKDKWLTDIQEGNAVSFKVNGKEMFYGYIFSKRRDDASTITIKCYDQLRYLKNKDTLSYTDKTYGELLKMLADDYKLKCGDIADTKHKMTKIEECSPLEMLSNASDETIMKANELYVLYDDFGKLTLKPLKDMLVPVIITESTCEKIDYETTIDSNVYNRIKIAQDNSTTGERETYTFQDGESQAKWGVLQYYAKLETPQSQGSDTAGGGGTVDISGEANTAAAIWAFMVSAGYTEAAVAGIMGNMYAESGLVTTALNPSSKTYGLCQWGWSRKTDLSNFAKRKGKPMSDLQTQLEFLVYELVTYYSGKNYSVNGVPLNTYLKQVTSVQNAEYYFVRKFERGSDAEIRSSEGKRLSKANAYFTSFSGGKYKQYLSGGGGASAAPASATLLAAEDTDKKEETPGTTDKPETSEGEKTDSEGIALGDTAAITKLGEMLLKYYNRKQRKLSVMGCFGVTAVRGGSCVYVNLNLGDMKLNNYMLVENVTHHFNSGIHKMDLKLSGINGEFNV